MYKAIKISKGTGGFGGPLTIKPEEGKDKVISVTGGGIHPVAQKIADMTGATVIDGFFSAAPDSEVMVAVIDCGGTARCGVYPKKRIPTVNTNPVGKSGPLAKFITEDIYVSGVREQDIVYADAADEANIVSGPREETVEKETKPNNNQPVKKAGLVERIGKGAGNVIGIFYAAGKDSIDSVMSNILPFMAFISMLIGIINKSGIGTIIAEAIAPLSGTLPGMLVISIICAIPILSPLLGPGAVIAQVVGVLVGVEIGKGNIPPQYALPALFAINPQVGCDFIPVGLSLAEAETETIEVGVPAILFSRQLTGPLAVVIAYFFSFGLFK